MCQSFPCAEGSSSLWQGFPVSPQTLSALPGSAAHLDQCGVQVHVVGHDDSTHDPHGLLQLRRSAVLAVGDKEPLEQLLLVGSDGDVLGTREERGCVSAVLWVLLWPDPPRQSVVELEPPRGNCSVELGVMS